MRALIALALLLAGCAGGGERVAPDQLSARIAPDIVLNMPRPPGYPETTSVNQIVRAQYGERRGAFEAALALSPEEVRIVIVAPSGPRLATIVWTGAGITQDAAMLTLSQAPTENVLADIFLALWPHDAVQAALPAGVEVREEDNGGRTILRAGAPIMEIRRDPADASRTTQRNLALGYELTITSTAAP